MESWLGHGADLLALDEQGRNCLHHAASKGSNIAVHGLLGKYKFYPNGIDWDGWMALHWAAKSLRGGTMARIARISRTSRTSRTSRILAWMIVGAKGAVM